MRSDASQSVSLSDVVVQLRTCATLLEHCGRYGDAVRDARAVADAVFEAVGRRYVVLSPPLSSVVSPASIAGGDAEGVGAEKRSAPNDADVAMLRDVAERTAARLTNEKRALQVEVEALKEKLEAVEFRACGFERDAAHFESEVTRLKNVIAVVERERNEALKNLEAHRGTVDLQARRIATLQDVARICRVALVGVLQFLRDRGDKHPDWTMPEVAQAVEELDATLTDEAAPSSADRRATLTPPTSDTPLEVAVAGGAKWETTFGEFVSDEPGWLAQAVQTLKVGGSRRFAFSNRPAFVVTRKAA